MFYKYRNDDDYLFIYLKSIIIDNNISQFVSFSQTMNKFEFEFIVANYDNLNELFKFILKKVVYNLEKQEN